MKFHRTTKLQHYTTSLQQKRRQYRTNPSVRIKKPACHYSVQRRDLPFGVARERVAALRTPSRRRVSCRQRRSRRRAGAAQSPPSSGVAPSWLPRGAAPSRRCVRAAPRPPNRRCVGGRNLPNLSLIVWNRKRRRWYG
jgi:hypothetical protein